MTVQASLLSMQKKKEKKGKSYYCSTVRDYLPVHFAMEAEPPWKHPCLRQTTLFGQVVVKNVDNVQAKPSAKHISHCRSHFRLRMGGGDEVPYENSFVCPRCGNF